MKVCVVVSGGLVETLQAAPVIAALHEATAEPVLVVCPAAAAAVAAELSGAGEVVPVVGLGSGRPGALVRLWVELRRRRISVVLVCSEAASVRAAVYLAGVPRRIGSVAGLSDRLLTDRVPSERGQNRQLVWLTLLRPLELATVSLGGHRYTPGAAAAVVAEQMLLSNGVEDGRLLVAVAPGSGFAEADVAAWSAERFAHLANRLATRHGAGIVLVGDARDRERAEAMRLDLAAETVNLCGELDLATTAAVIARCDLLISADTPLLHLAAAVGTASVGLFGSTSGRLRAPAGSAHRVVQAIPDGTSPAGLERIRVDDVLAGIESTL